MKIVLVNWAPIWDGASFGGGVNGYVQSLALELVRRGHDVTSLFGGLVYVDPPTGPFIRRHDDWLGIRILEVVNSPVLAPSFSQFREPLGEVAQPALERLVGQTFRHLRPDVIHFHNLEGFSAGCIRHAREAAPRARVLFSLHNYHTLCPQVTLTRDHRWACHDFDSGHACEGCVKAPEPAAVRAERLAEFQHRHAESIVHHRASLRQAWGSLKHELSWPKRLVVKSAGVVRALARVRAAAQREAGGLVLPGRPVRDQRDMLVPRSVPVPEFRGQGPALLAARAGAAPKDRRDLPVLNVIQPQSCSREANAYGVRRREMVAALGTCDEVLAVSTFVARKFQSMGVPARRLRVVPIGTRAGEIVTRRPELCFQPPTFARAPGRPVRLVFLGYNHFNKGLPLLADALDLLTPEQLARIDLSIFALGGETIEHRFRALEPRLAKLTLRHGYQPDDLPLCLSGKDLTYVGSTWWDPAPQTVFESFACGVPVLGADLGGIPDFVHHGVNGLLFRGDDSGHLAETLRSVLDDPTQLDRLRRGVRPHKGMAEHAEELERLYAGRESALSHERSDRTSPLEAAPAQRAPNRPGAPSLDPLSPESRPLPSGHPVQPAHRHRPSDRSAAAGPHAVPGGPHPAASPLPPAPAAPADGGQGDA